MTYYHYMCKRCYFNKVITHPNPELIPSLISLRCPCCDGDMELYKPSEDTE